MWRRKESVVVAPPSPNPVPPEQQQIQEPLPQHRQPQNITRDLQSLREIKQLKETISQLQEVIRNQVSKQQQYEILIQEMKKDRDEMKDMFTALINMIAHSQLTSAGKAVQVTPHDAPTTPVMSGPRSHMTVSPAAVGNRSRGNSMVNLATQSLITSTIKPVTQPTSQQTIATHNAFTALMQQKPQPKPATTTPQSTVSTDEEKEDDNDDDDVMSINSATPQEASSFSLGKKHNRNAGPSPNKKPKKKTKPHSTKYT